MLLLLMVITIIKCMNTNHAIILLLWDPICNQFNKDYLKLKQKISREAGKFKFLVIKIIVSEINSLSFFVLFFFGLALNGMYNFQRKK